MKAVVQTKYGGPEVLSVQYVEKPSPNGNEVLIKIHAAGVTAADSMMRAGKPKYGRLFLGLRGPKHKTPGTGFAGIVESVGPEVTRFAEGDELFGEIVFGSGTYAEYVAVPEDGVIAKKPTHYSFEEAAAVSDGPLTSINFLKDVTSVVPGQRVLINGASGSLGSAAVQLAKHFGAHVTGVCSTANIELVKSLGADEVIDYTQQDFTRSSEQWDVIYDTVGKSSFGHAKRALTSEGVYLSPVLSLPLLLHMMATSIRGRKKAKFAATGMKAIPELRELLSEVVQIINDGKLGVHIDRRFPLVEVSRAHELVDTGRKRGNVVLAISP